MADIVDDEVVEEPEEEGYDPQDEINEMLEALGGPQNVKPPEGDTESEGEDDEALRDSEEEEPDDEGDGGSEDTSSEGEDVEEPNPIDEKLAAMEAEIKRLKEAAEEIAPEPEPEPEPEGPIDFVEDLDTDELFDNKDGINELLNKVFRAVDDKYRKMFERVPAVIEYQIGVTNRVNDFYHQNPDLSEHKEKVQEVMTEYVKDNPDKSIDEILKEAAPLARKKLGLKPGANPKPKPKTPPLPRKKGSRVRPAKTKMSDVESEIDAMNKALGIRR